MSLHSRFRFWALLPAVLLLLVTAILAFATSKLMGNPNLPSFGIFVFLGLFVFTWVWLFFGELRTKVIKVQIERAEIIVSNYLGLGVKRIYNFSQLDGLETALLPSKYDTYEYLYLLENGKKVIKLSQFYHSNYDELKNVLTGKIRNLGQKEFSYFLEVKEIFT